MKTIRHQSFIILLPPYIRKHLMIIVTTSHQNFENENSYRELIVSTTTYNKKNFTHFFVHKHHKNSQKSSQKLNTTRTHYFITQRSYLNISQLNPQKHLLVAISWLFDWMDLCPWWGVENFISRKNRLCRKWKKKWRYNGDMFLLLDENSFATRHAKTFLWKPTMHTFSKDKIELHRRCSGKKILFNVSQNSQEKTCAGVSLFLETFLKSVSSTVVSLWTLQIF